MQKFSEWLKNKHEGFNDFLPNMGQRATPYPKEAQPNQAPSQPKQISLSTMADQISDLTWHQLYDVFSKQHQRFPSDPKVGQLGQALYQAAQSGNMSGLQPFKQQLQAQSY